MTVSFDIPAESISSNHPQHFAPLNTPNFITQLRKEVMPDTLLVFERGGVGSESFISFPSLPFYYKATTSNELFITNYSIAMRFVVYYRLLVFFPSVGVCGHNIRELIACFCSFSKKRYIIPRSFHLPHSIGVDGNNKRIVVDAIKAQEKADNLFIVQSIFQ